MVSRGLPNNFRDVRSEKSFPVQKFWNGENKIRAHSGNKKTDYQNSSSVIQYFKLIIRERLCSRLQWSSNKSKRKEMCSTKHNQHVTRVSVIILNCFSVSENLTWPQRQSHDPRCSFKRDHEPAGICSTGCSVFPSHYPAATLCAEWTLWLYLRWCVCVTWRRCWCRQRCLWTHSVHVLCICILKKNKGKITLYHKQAAELLNNLS